MHISKNDLKILNKHPRFSDISCGLRASVKQPSGIYYETASAIAVARRFVEQVVRPKSLELDKRMYAEPDYLPWEFIQQANEWGFYSMWIPRIFGGKGYSMTTMSPFLEEVSTGCVAMANLIGVHYLGVAILCATWNAKVINRICQDIRQGEKTGKPCLVSLAITEPGAGTDVEEIELLDRAHITCLARRVKGGYILNGSKVFISNGHLSTWHIVIAYEDKSCPSEKTVFLAVRTGTPGFSFGRMEHKMGQKACPASELVFDDCFVPDEFVCIGTDDYKSLRRSPRSALMQVIDYVVSVSRAGVCGFGTGVARGAFEEAFKYVQDTKVDGQPLIDFEWVQCYLAEMYINIALSRLAYVETNFANGLYGFFKILQNRYIYNILKYLPLPIIDRLITPLLNHSIATRIFRLLHLDMQSDDEIRRTSGWASIAKIAGTNAGMNNCRLALDIMGCEGLKHENRVEKHLRDARLMQIYEGTNQLNKINVFKNLIAADMHGIKIFQE